MSFAPQLATFFLITTCVGFLMILSGVGKKTLDWTRTRRVCPGCRHEIRHGRCACLH